MISNKKICPNCGNKVSLSAGFCNECGEKFLKFSLPFSDTNSTVKEENSLPFSDAIVEPIYEPAKTNMEPIIKNEDNLDSDKESAEIQPVLVEGKYSKVEVNKYGIYILRGRSPKNSTGDFYYI